MEKGCQCKKEERREYFKQAINAYQSAAELENEYQDRSCIRLIYNLYEMSLLYEKIGEKEKSREKLLRIIEIYERSDKQEELNDFEYMNALGKIADILYSEGDKERALIYYKKLRKYRYVPQLWLYGINMENKVDRED